MDPLETRGARMTTTTTCPALAALLMTVLGVSAASAQLMTTCAEHSPERRGELGCTIVATKALPDRLAAPVFWHLDRFASLERARAAVGPAGIAFEAAGAAWLSTIEPQTTEHHGGVHVTQVGPLSLPPAATRAMLIQSARFTPGMYSLDHHQSGVEAVYVIEGEACYTTPEKAFRLKAGETLALAGGITMRAVVTGSRPRHVLAIIIHDAAQPATMRMPEGTGPPLASCQ
jgi:quercetin dioxygenase-like cupin family protein